MKMYRVTFITKENRQQYVHVADVEAKNAKEAKNIVQEKWSSNYAPHAFQLEAKPIDALQYDMHKLTYIEYIAYRLQCKICFANKCIAEDGEAEHYKEWIAEAEKQIAEERRTAEAQNRLTEVEKGIAIADVMRK